MFEIVASHPEVTQALFTVGYSKEQSADAKMEPLAVSAINLSCMRPGLRCLSLREPKRTENGGRLEKGRSGDGTLNE